MSPESLNELMSKTRQSLRRAQLILEEAAMDSPNGKLDALIANILSDLEYAVEATR